MGNQLIVTLLQLTHGQTSHAPNGIRTDYPSMRALHRRTSWYRLCPQIHCCFP